MRQISPGRVTKRFSAKKDRKALKRKAKEQTRQFKRRRLVLKKSKGNDTRKRKLEKEQHINQG